MPMLIVMTPRGETTLIPVTEPETTIGRAEHNHVVLASQRVSRFHAALTTDGPMVTLRDLGSRNGTFVNGKRIEAQVLANGDNIDIAGYWIRFLAVHHESVTADALQQMRDRGPLV